MPIVTIKYSNAIEEKMAAKMISGIRDSGAQILDCAADNIWVLFLTVNEGGASQRLPPIVSIEASGGRSERQRDSFVRAVAENISKGLQVAVESVWIHYQEMRPQDIWSNERLKVI